MKRIFSWMVAALLGFSICASAEGGWQIHEWGTFTSLQDENGEAIGGINTDDEPVPPFVHRLADFLLLRTSEVPRFFFQGAPSCHPDVTMRLETPVIYFHPPATETQVQSANIKVTFQGGWLSEFYPDARSRARGLIPGTMPFPHLRSNTESSLEWNNLQIGGDWPLTDTSAHVWTSPRAVQAAAVRSASGESEKFLFYRGVAHIDAPLTISRDAKTGELLFRSQLGELPAARPLGIRSIWLVDIQPGGRIAFRALSPLVLDHPSDTILMRTPPGFAPADYEAGNLAKLKMALKEALMCEGLFADEAQALLNTWELSYFKSHGLRVFFLVPRAWTDFYLPLEVSLPAEIHRVMVGRIELVTSEERNNLRQLAGFSPATIHEQARELWTNYFGNMFLTFTNQEDTQKREKLNRDLALVNAGQKTLASLVSIPKSYQTYLELGRFRNALILDEAKNRPSVGLTNFIATYGLQAYRPVDHQPGN